MLFRVLRSWGFLVGSGLLNSLGHRLSAENLFVIILQIGWLRNSIFKISRNTKFRRNYFYFAKFRENKIIDFREIILRKSQYNLRNFRENLKLFWPNHAGLVFMRNFHSKIIYNVIDKKYRKEGMIVES